MVYVAVYGYKIDIYFSVGYRVSRGLAVEETMDALPSFSHFGTFISPFEPLDDVAVLLDDDSFVLSSALGGGGSRGTGSSVTWDNIEGCSGAGESTSVMALVLRSATN